MVATLEKLLDVRSQAAGELIKYLQAMEDDLAKNKLLERFQQRKLEELRIPLCVVTHEPVRDTEALLARERFRFSGQLDEGDDKEKNARRAYTSHGNLSEDDNAKPLPLLIK